MLQQKEAIKHLLWAETKLNTLVLNVIKREFTLNDEYFRQIKGHIHSAETFLNALKPQNPDKDKP